MNASTRPSAVLAQVLVLALAACDERAAKRGSDLSVTAGDAPRASDLSTRSAPSAAAGVPSASAHVAASASRPAVPARVAPRPAAMPAIPTDRSPRPTPEEWKASTPLLDVEGCTASIVREWARVRCGLGMWVRHSAWGKPGEDHVEDLLAGAVDFRLHPGVLLRGAHSEAGVALQVAWPTTDPQPWMFTLERPRPSGPPAPFPAPHPIPEVPAEDHDRPPEADWVAALPVNSAARETPTRDCNLAVRGLWARLHCRPFDGKGSFHAWETFTGFGTKKVDHVETLLGIVGDSVQLDFRLRRGGKAHAILIWINNGRRASVKYEWPEGAPRPTVLSLVEIEAAAPQ